jgi:hypothetical protein
LIEHFRNEGDNFDLMAAEDVETNGDDNELDEEESVLS